MNLLAHVSLPMYDWPEVAQYTDKLWHSIGSVFDQTGIDRPSRLQRTLDSKDVWTGGKCLFSQTCGWPYIHQYAESLDLILTPHYDIEGCTSAYHASRIVCRRDDRRSSLQEFQQARAVINEVGSQSGHQALKTVVTNTGIPAPFFSNCLVSGSHRESIRMVASEEADICAIDPVSWQLARRHENKLVERLKVIGEGPTIPGLPYVASTTFREQFIQHNLLDRLEKLLLSGLDDEIREHLFISGSSRLARSDYSMLQQLDDEARAAGHQSLLTP